MTVYLDNAATTRVCPQAAQAALHIMTENYGNPSSTHLMGRNAKKALEDARAQVASAMGAAPEEIFFTSCGSEGDNWALLSGAELMKHKGNHIISSTVEHSAVLKALDELEARGYCVTRLKPLPDGSISPEAVLAALRPDTILASFMLVNNETGAVTDICRISQLMKSAKSKALLHTDAVQGFLKVPFSAKTLGADLITVSGHKIHAPKGIGALYIKGGEKAIKLKPLIIGGAQEYSRRAGTEALPQIAAFGVAAQLGATLQDEACARMSELKSYAVSRLSREIPETLFLSGDAGHIISLSLPGYKSEWLMNLLESKEIYVSRSSACKKGARSYVLSQMGLPPAVIDGAIRVGLSRYTTTEEIDALCDGLLEARNRFTPVK